MAALEIEKPQLESLKSDIEESWPLTQIRAAEFVTIVARDLSTDSKKLAPWLVASRMAAEGVLDSQAPSREAYSMQPSKVSGASGTPCEDRLRRFVHELAQPEPRESLAGHLGLDCQTISEWVQQADLLRESILAAGLTPERARALVEDDHVLGVHDLARRLATNGDGLKSLEDWRPDRRDALLRVAQRESPRLITRTDVILVVKGAGQQKPGETLDQFTRGFWPAIQSVDSDATVRNRDDIIPEITHDGELPGRVTEITSGERRIWLSEPNWESALRIAASRRAVLREWRLATWVLVLETHLFLRSWMRFLGSFLPARLADVVRRTHEGMLKLFRSIYGGNQDREGDSGYLEVRVRALFKQEPFLMVIAYATAYCLVFGFVGLVLYRDGFLAEPSMESSWPALVSNPFLWLRFGLLERAPWLASSVPGRYLATIAPMLLPAVIAAFPTAINGLWKRYVFKRERDDRGSSDIGDAARSDQQFPRPNSLTNAALLMLGALLLLTPVRYATLLILLMLVQLALIIARRVFWRFRPFPLSDVDEHYVCGPRSGQCPTAIKNDRRRPRFPLIWYRLIVVLALPLFYVASLLADFLKFTRILGKVGESLERAISTVIGGIMGDVVTYAMDPSQAARIRSAVDREFRAYHDMSSVHGIHIVAHSQGTPITYELLFRHLHQSLREKLCTYLTLGSVLSYYCRANAVMGEHNVQRFPVDKPPRFPTQFRWFNCWNLSDPITEFTGLDDFRWEVGGRADEAARSKDPMAGEPGLYPPSEGDGTSTEDLEIAADLARLGCTELEDTKVLAGASDLIVFHPASPRDIRTPMSIRHHGDYWTNLEWVQRPMALRVLDVDPEPRRWRIATRNQDSWWLPHWGW